MAVYVDKGLEWVPSKKWPYPKVHHMYADSAEKLHEFAIEVLGLKRSSCSDHTKPYCRLLHYDLSPGKYKEALAKGAVLDVHGRYRGRLLSKKKTGTRKGFKHKRKMDTRRD